jgi:hypothetical protein
MSGPYGRQEVPDLPGSDLSAYLARYEAAARSEEEDGEVRYTETRLRLFAVMLGRPEEEWTAARLASALGEQEPVTANIVRDTFYLLMHERHAEPVPFQRGLTVRLTPAGRRVLKPAVTRWRAEARSQAVER